MELKTSGLQNYFVSKSALIIGLFMANGRIKNCEILRDYRIGNRLCFS